MLRGIKYLSIAFGTCFFFLVYLGRCKVDSSNAQQLVSDSASLLLT